MKVKTSIQIERLGMWRSVDFAFSLFSLACTDTWSRFPVSRYSVDWEIGGIRETAGKQRSNKDRGLESIYDSMVLLVLALKFVHTSF